jgi:hypothetical protein
LEASLRLTCTQHPVDQVEYFCGSCQQLACVRCVVDLHGDHLELCRRVTRRHLDGYLDQIVEKLSAEKQRIAELLSGFQTLQIDTHKSEPAEVFMERVSESQRTLATRLKSPEHVEQICFMSARLQPSQLDDSTLLDMDAHYPQIK